MTEKIKFVKYPNRRIYDTKASCYVPFSGIKKRIMQGDIIEVIDQKTKEDVTREVLISILLEDGLVGEGLFSEDLMKMIIRFYGNPMQDRLRSFFDASQDFMNSLLKNLNK